jgi:hypothetical protein
VPTSYASAVFDAPYRAPLPVEPDPYLVAWADLRRRRRSAAGAFGPSLAASLFAVVFTMPALLGVAAVLFGASWVAWRYLSAFRCPSCSHSFVHGRLRRHERGWSDRQCGYCGIAIGTPKSAVVELEMRRAQAQTQQAQQAR